jgi:crossover junction endodeoxyribonuclease RuvC
MTYLSIDPGKDGFIVQLAKVDDQVVFAAGWPMPVIESTHKGRRELNTPAIRDIIEFIKPKMVFIEQQFTMPRDGHAGVLSVGRGWGLIEGICIGLYVPYMNVPSQKWHKIACVGTDGDKAKSRSQMAAKRLFPTVDFRSSERCRIDHQGKMDAAVMGWAAITHLIGVPI